MTRPLICPAHADTVDAEHFRECDAVNYAVARNVAEDSHAWPSVTALLGSPRQSAILHFFPDEPVNPKFFLAAEIGQAWHKHLAVHDGPTERWFGDINGLELSGEVDYHVDGEYILDYKTSSHPRDKTPYGSHKVQVGLYNILGIRSGRPHHPEGRVEYTNKKQGTVVCRFPMPTLAECLAYEVWEGQTVADNIVTFKWMVDVEKHEGHMSIDSIRRCTGGLVCPCDLIKFGKATMAEKYCAVVDMCKGREF